MKKLNEGDAYNWGRSGESFDDLEGEPAANLDENKLYDAWQRGYDFYLEKRDGDYWWKKE